MNDKKYMLLIILGIVFGIFFAAVNFFDSKTLNGIKNKKVGDGQYGTARWATKNEIKKTFVSLPFEPEK